MLCPGPPATIVPAGSMKWDATQRKRVVFNFTAADAVVAAAEANGQMMRCHTPLWHLSTPSWVTEGGFDNETLIDIMTDHIRVVLPHYRGRCYAWDVVNEAVYNNGSWHNSVFYDTIGPAYVPIAFAAAAEADPHAKLYLNDFAIEVPGPKADATYEIAKMVRDYGVKIDGIGIQGHIDLSGMPLDDHYELGSRPTYDDLVEVMTQYASLGIELAITELDVAVLTPVTAENATIYETQAEVYYNVTAACLTFEECVGITIWDWTDRYTWVPDVFPDMGDALVWDKDLKKKPAYGAS
ncbi:hypothetical protein SAPIO_CDS1891 [Scedosporium apiospermum]|uniref:Beta-xylanase n=1 Tax=Pseudallescheria apiosperma TaxID=563466 RepID=A0A084GDZ4_PSEDA|nr:uncharacterized protein SAPIO_CDS1891 [Scedosporium apiospermum]KEZ45556.1 hypothetical protein SAPIO_CDS1891 [Scedosporium apiospermum]